MNKNATRSADPLIFDPKNYPEDRAALGAVRSTDWLEELTKNLRTQAQEIAAAGHNGWGNTMLAAAEEIEKLRTEIDPHRSVKDEWRRVE